MTTTVPDYGLMNDADLQAHAAALIPVVHARVDASTTATAKAKRRASHLHDVADDLEALLFSGGQVAARSGDGKEP